MRKYSEREKEKMKKKTKAVMMVSEIENFGFSTIGFKKKNGMFCSIYLTNNQLANEITLSNENGYFSLEYSDCLWSEIKSFIEKERTELEIINFWYKMSKIYNVTLFSTEFNKLINK